MQVSLYDYLKNGKFGSLQFGDSRTEVIQKLKRPDEWSNEEISEAYRFDYRGLAVFFENDEVDCFTVSVLPPGIVTPCTWTDMPYPYKITHEESKIFLVRQGISFEEGGDMDGMPWASIKTEGGVLLCEFPNTEGPEESWGGPLTVGTLVLQRSIAPDVLKRRERELRKKQSS